MKICCSTVALSSKSGFWIRYSTLTLPPIITLPLSGYSTPEIIFNNVDLPVPLIPITPILSSSSIAIEIFSSSILSL